MSYVHDPVTDGLIPLHILWDSHAMRVASLEAVDRATQEFMQKYPRSFFPELKAHPVGDPAVFVEWAKESHQVALDWAYDLQTLPDPNKDQDSETLVRNMVNFILTGESHVKKAPRLTKLRRKGSSWGDDRHFAVSHGSNKAQIGDNHA